ncbi:MAG: c-type cytochrome [Bryobacteraceae bacterium]
MRILLSLRSALIFLAIASAAFAEPQAGTPAEGAARGKKLFAAHCSSCHGTGGTGGRGPNLATPALKHGTSIEAIAGIVAQGIPGTEMPGSWVLGPKEVVDIAVFVRSLAVVKEEKLAGDAAKGAAVFHGKGNCWACHIVQGKGMANGPELSRVGGQRSAAYLREAILDPGAQVAPEYLMVQATPRLGKPVLGLRVNEDSFTIQIQDMAGGRHSLEKRDLKDLKKFAKQSAMPDFKNNLTGDEVENLVAYLASLR